MNDFKIKDLLIDHIFERIRCIRDAPSKVQLSSHCNVVRSILLEIST